MTNKDPFRLKLGKPIDAQWREGRFLDFDQSSVDPRFGQNYLEEERLPFNKRLWFLVVLLIFGIFVLRLAVLQTVNYQKYYALAEGNRLRVQYLLAPRGLVFDQYGERLVANEPSFELVVTPLDLPKDEDRLAEEISLLATFLNLEEAAVNKALDASDKNSFFPITLKQGVEKEKAIAFIAREEAFPGFSIQNNPKRSYIDGPMFAHIVGYAGKLEKGEHEKLKNTGYVYNDVVGREGLEAEYEEYMRGKLGERLVEVDASGVVKNTFQQKEPSPGADLVLHVDSQLQKVLYDSLNKQLKARGAKRAAAVAIDPKTGGVLAMVSLPSFDNNLFAAGIPNEQYERLINDQNFPLFNRSASGTYPPGSTIKPLLASAALQEEVVTEKTRIFDSGKLLVPHQYNPGVVYTFRGWNPNGLGYVDVYSAIAMSSDIYFYTVGGGQELLGISGLGPEKMAEYLRKFYFGRITGIDLPAEKSGLVPDPEWKKQRFAGDEVAEKWYLGDSYNMSIGQGFVLASPLQLTVATAAIANGGKVLRPQLLKKVVNREGREIKVAATEVLAENFVDPKYLEIVKKGMRQTVTAGTARTLSSLSIAVAGKTGTSQFDGSDLSRTHAWFTAFAPYDNPKIVLTVLIEAGGEGSGAAVPVAAEALAWYSKNRIK